MIESLISGWEDRIGKLEAAKMNYLDCPMITYYLDCQITELRECIGNLKMMTT